MTRIRPPVLLVAVLLVVVVSATGPAVTGAVPTADDPTLQVSENETATADGEPTDDGQETVVDSPLVANETLDILQNDTSRALYFVEGLRNRTSYQYDLLQGLPSSVGETGDRLSGLDTEASAERNETIDAMRRSLRAQQEALWQYNTQVGWQLDAAEAYRERLRELNETVDGIDNETVRTTLQRHVGFHADALEDLIESLEVGANASRTALDQTIQLDEGLATLRNQTTSATPTPGGDQETPLFDEDSDGLFAEEVTVSDLTSYQSERAAAVENVSAALDDQVRLVRALSEYVAQQRDVVAGLGGDQLPDPAAVERLHEADGGATPVGTDDDGPAPGPSPTEDAETNDSDDSDGPAGVIGPGFALVTALLAAAIVVAVIVMRRR